MRLHGPASHSHRLQLLVGIGVVLVALAATGLLAARLGGAAVSSAVIRNVVGGGLALAATYAIGHLVGVAVG